MKYTPNWISWKYVVVFDLCAMCTNPYSHAICIDFLFMGNTQQQSWVIHTIFTFGWCTQSYFNPQRQYVLFETLGAIHSFLLFFLGQYVLVQDSYFFFFATRNTSFWIFHFVILSFEFQPSTQVETCTENDQLATKREWR